MSKNTKDAERLKQLFLSLGNNPTTIAQCISRPYLVDKLLIDNYNLSDSIHNDTKINANFELSKYLKSYNIDDVTAQNNLVTYKKSNIQNERTISPFDLKNSSNIELNEKEFQYKLAETKSLNLKETSNAFIYSEIVNTNQDSFEVRFFQWKKEKFNNWFSKQNVTKIDKIVTIPEFKIPEINLNIVNKLESSISIDKWEIQNMPDARQQHSVVWTGTEMIIWGGYNNSNLNTGGRYNPITDTWIGINTDNAPEARFAPAVWTGTEMVIWGGATNFNTQENTITVNTGSRYNPNTDSWESMNNNPPISNRFGHSMVWTGSNIIIWGGYNNVSYLNTGALYDPELDSWELINSFDAPTPRSANSFWTGTEMLVWGGYNGKFISTGKKYNPANDSWSEISDINKPQARLGESVVWTGDTLVVWGGLDSDFNYLISGSRYNPSLDTWENMTEIGSPSKSSNNNVVWSGEEMIVWGGDTYSTSVDGGRYNPVSDIWLQINHTGEPTPRSFATSVWTGSEMIIWGGFDNQRVNTGGRYNPLNDSWIDMGRNNQPEIRDNHSSIWTGTEMIIWGGFNGDNLQSGNRYNPVTDTWQMTSVINAPRSRQLHSALWTGTEMIVLGGEVYLEDNIGTITVHSSGGRYNPLTDSWVATNEENAPKLGFNKPTIVWTGSEAIVWGIDFMGLLGGRYNPELDSWLTLSEVDAPELKNHHSAIWTGDEMIVWGGSDTQSGDKYNPLNDNWTSVSLINAPPTRERHTAIWTGTHMIIWGGRSSSNGILNSGGMYDPNTDSWLAMPISNAPIARYLHTSVWTGNEMMVWGGRTGGLANVLNSGGYFNPESNSWSQMTINGAPHARSRHTANWTGEKMIIWGGWVDNTLLSSNSLGIYDMRGNDVIFNNGFEN